MKLSILYDQYFQVLSVTDLRAVEEAAPGVEIIYCGQNNSAHIKDIIDSDVIFGKPPLKMLKDLGKLKWIHLPSAGADPYANESIYANPTVLLTKSSGTFGIPIAEYVIGMMVALNHNFATHHKNQQDSLWRQDWTDSYDIFGSNVLVLGLGDIGTEVCRRLSGFGCHITGFRRDTAVQHGLVDELRQLSQLRECLPNADCIVVCLPGTEETRSLIGRCEFDLMKERAIIINVGRGNIIDTDALVDALNNKKIAAACLDVTEPEPLPVGHPLWKARNVLITPHVSAFSPGLGQRRLSIFIDLLKRYLSGQPMYNTVDFVKGY